MTKALCAATGALLAGGGRSGAPPVPADLAAGAKLQLKAARGVNVMPDACTAGFTLGGGVRFIDYNQVTHGDNLGGVDLTTAFSCISAVGESACGFESPLESVYQALHDPIH